MDNVTHALAGLLVAEAIVSSTSPRGGVSSVAFRRRAWLVSALSNNLPDFDFVYTWITEGRLGYLLHHRGHTHTLLAAVVLGLLTFFASDALARRRLRKVAPGDPEPDRREARRERRVIAALALAGPFIHIGMDFFNNYGVHPFWPVVDDWFYGDSIFIIEPWFLVFTVPPLFFGCRSLVAKALLALFLAVGVGLAWVFPLVNLLTALVLTLAAAFWFWWCARAPAERRAVQSLVGSLVVLATFVIAGRVARARVLQAASTPDTSELDAVLTPAPSNPVCWSAISVAARASRYELRVATLSLLPALVPAESCRFEPSGRSLPPSTERFGSREHSRTAAVGTAPPGLRWDLAWHAPLAELRTLSRSNCDAAAFLRFSRAPYFFSMAEGRVYLGDLRYDRAPELEFAELEVPAEPTRCPRFVPPWRPPRHELLETR
jgi:inner membrane protein